MIPKEKVEPQLQVSYVEAHSSDDEDNKDEVDYTPVKEEEGEPINIVLEPGSKPSRQSKRSL